MKRYLLLFGAVLFFILMVMAVVKADYSTWIGGIMGIFIGSAIVKEWV